MHTVITRGIRTRPTKTGASYAGYCCHSSTNAFFLACQKITDVSNSNTVAREELKKEKGECSIELFYQKEFRVILSCSLESKDKDIRLTCFKFSCKLISAGKNTEWDTYFSVVNDFFSYLSYSTCPRFLNDYLHSNIQCSPPHHTHTCVTFSRHANKVSNDHIP